MNLKSKLISALALLGVISCSSIYATEITSVFSGETITRDTVQTLASDSEDIVPITLGIEQSEYQTNNGNVYWAIKDSNETYKDLYCLNLARGFGNPDGNITNANSTKTYSNQYDLNKIGESEYQTYTGLTTANKNKILWILNNSLTSKDDMSTFLTAASEKVEEAGWASYVKEDMKNNNDSRTSLTFEDIKMVGQIAIWHYTNSESIFDNTITGICDSNGNQISSQGENILVDTDTYYNYVRSGIIKQAKINAIYQYFIDGAESGSSESVVPSLTLSNSNTKVTESDNNYIIGPFTLTGTNTDLIKEITANVNIDYTLLTSSKASVANNDFSEVIGSNFYLQIAKSKITSTTEISVELTYTYDVRELTLLTDASDVSNTQPVVLVESEEKSAKTNTDATIELTNVFVEKVWEDGNNQDGKRPLSITINLLADNTKIDSKTVTVDSEGKWECTFTKLLKNKDGKEVSYTVTENTVSNYTTTISGNEANGFTITNSYTPAIIDISGTKTWEDSNNQDGKRPASIIVNLLANGTKIKDTTVTAADDWKYSFTNLPKYEDGKEITYTITEDAVTDYTTTTNGYNITNKYTPSKVSKTVVKKWEDGNDTDEIRPSEISVELYKLENGQEVTIETQKLKASNSWTYTWNDLDEKSNGEKIVYGIKEIGTIEGYTTTYSAENYENTDTITITNTHVSKDLAIQLLKVDEQGNIITSSEVKFEITGTEELTSETNQGILHLNSQKLVGDTFEFTYMVKETKAPTGYNEISDELTIKISGTTKVENGSYIIDTINLTDKNGNNLDNTKISAEYNSELNKVVIKVVNTKIENGYSVKLLKVGEDRTTAIEGAWFKVDDGQAIQVSKDGNEIDTGTLNNENELELIYSLEETQAPDGYVKINDKQEVKIKAKVELKDNEYQITEINLQEELENITISEENNVITIKVKNEVAVTGAYNVVLRKVDENGNILEGSKFKVNGTEYDLSTGEVIMYENQQITNLEDIDLTYVIKETVVPEGYNGIESAEVNIKAQVQKIDNNYKLIRATLVDPEGNNITDEKICIKLEGQSIVIEIKNTPIEKQFDLSLRKFVTKVNDIEYSREPAVDTSTIASTGTATYKHSKQPIAVQKGDIVTYTIRVYNEGELDGYVDKITDYLPDNLLPIIDGIEGIDKEKYAEEIEFNSNWLWSYLGNGNTITTTITSKLNTETYSVLTGIEEVEDTKLEAYVEGSDKLDYIDVQIKCLVTNDATDGEFLTNIAEITESQDINGKQGDGTDSSLANVDYSNLSDYKNDKAISSTPETYVLGQEDDDDFEKLVVKEFDLSLRKFIVKINETTYSREPVVDTSKLGTVENGKTITTATYNHLKEPVIVETNDIVTYTIRVYNEGTIAGYANEIIDNIPEGLEFLTGSEINKLYTWEMIDSEGNKTDDVNKAVIIITDYLSNNTESNKIEARTETEGVKTLNYKDVQVQFKVIAEPKNLEDNIIINEAQISADSDRDIDSEPNRDERYDYTNKNNEDDIDYEPIKLQYFDLALRKFVTKVNSVDYNNRYPEIIYNVDGSITYKHTKDPVLVTTGDTVIYTIRIYNEGEVSGYASEIKDNLPEGLAFDPNNEVNKLYGWKMIDKDANVTEDVEKVVAFKTNYLENEKIDALIEVNGSKVLSYKDVQIAFVVTESELSDRILVNIAQISEDSGDDIDSIPDNNVESEDDTDKEYIRVEYFDLSIKKWVTATKVTLDGKTTTTKTNYKEDSEAIAKVDIVASKLKKTTVKFVYNIKVTNEGELPGYAYEVKDYIPKGFEFISEDNKDWKELKDGIVVTDKLKDTLLNPGESATVEIKLTWKNSSTNLGVKTNYAEISSDSASDIDSTPDNYDFTEDDMDDAQVILSIKTAGATTYVGLILITIAILAGGVFLIKKYVLN